MHVHEFMNLKRKEKGRWFNWEQKNVGERKIANKI
jgi:hypothetical protein